MERDFMGLSSKDSVIVVKEEAVESCKDSGLPKGSGVPWPMSNKVSALPHFMSFKSGQDEKPSKIVSDSHISSGFMAMSAADVFDLNQKRQGSEIQTSIHHHDRMLPFSFNNPSVRTHFVGAAQNFSGPTVKQHFIGGIPVTTPHSIFPSCGSAAGTTEPWLTSKAPAAPAQLTIFYAGTVNVYEDISPEKAQAIMFLAGNGYTVSNVGQSRVQVPVATPKLAAGDGAFANQNMNTPPGSAISSPLSVSSHPIGQSASVSIKNEEVKASKTTGMPTTPVSKVEPPTMVTTLGSVAASAIMPAAVPQARKASLARFLEKRKERVMNSAPYFSKKPAEFATHESNVVSFSSTSSAM